MRSRLPAATVFVTLLAIAGATERPSAQTQRLWSALLEEWIAAVETHQPAERDAHVITVQGWSNAEIELLFPYFHALLQFVHDPDRPRPATEIRRLGRDELDVLRLLARRARRLGDANTVIKLAALLHTDAATLAPPDREVIVPSPVDTNRQLRQRSTAGRSVVAELPDGNYTGMAIGSFHWQFTRRLLGSLDPGPASDASARAWYRAAAAHLANEFVFAELMPHLESAQYIFPSDAFLRFSTACLNEALATRHIQDAVRNMALPPGVTVRGMFSAETHLERAERQLQDVLALDASFAEARVRLARVRGLLGRREQAVRDLRQWSEPESDPATRYFAALFLGELEEDLGHAGAAREAFTRAASIFPRAQTPQLALSRLARAAGESATAMRLLQAAIVVDALGAEPFDPWGQYYRGPGRDADALLDAARRALIP